VTIIFNKSDLKDTKSDKLHDRYVKMYEKAGYICLRTSALTGDGVENLKKELHNNISLFAGHSGVGKSALINAIDSTLDVKTGEISDAHSKGKHTTTFAEMLDLSFGGFIIDTPGVKEFGVVDFEENEVSHYFPEMRDRILDCKFNNCTHVHEPSCAIKLAVENGDIDPIRYTNYLNILNNVEDYKEEWE